MTITNMLEQYLKEVINKCGYDIDDVTLVSSKLKEYGDFQINVAFSLAKKYGVKPFEIATNIANNIDKYFTNINIKGGFINLTIKDEVLLDYANKWLNDFSFFVCKNKHPKKIVLDYGGANIAKELHVGHLRCNIGEAIRRLLNLFGDETISDVHWGDFGTPLGLVMRQIQELYPDLVYFDSNYEGEYPKNSPVTNDELAKIYPDASKRKQEDEKYALEARLLTEKLQNKERGIYALWQQIVNVSKEDSKKIYDYLNCHFDYSYGESDAYSYVDDTLKFLEKSNKLEVSDGALIMNIKKTTEKKEMPPLILRKSDGAILYATSELATIYQRVKDFNPDAIWYFVDERQSLHFEQVFRASKISSLVRENVDLRFNGFGTINGLDGKPFKTRDGNVMSLKALIKLVYDKIEPKIKKEIVGKEREDIANKLTVATLKYSDLCPYRTTDYIFDVDKFTSFEGKTGIYAVYTTTRLKSLLKKIEISNYQIEKIYNEDIKNILIKLVNLSNILMVSYNEISTNYICDFIYELCSLYNKFYGEYNILNEEDLSKKNTYLSLSKLVYNTLSNLLNILAIDEVDRM